MMKWQLMKTFKTYGFKYEWIRIRHKEARENSYENVLRCPNCNLWTYVNFSIKYNYCPHCGARMEGVEE